MRRHVPQLSEYLIKRGGDPVAVREAAARYYQTDEARFGEWCVANGVVTRAQFVLSMADQEFARGHVTAAQNWLWEAEGLARQARLRAAASVGELRLTTLALQGCRR